MNRDGVYNLCNAVILQACTDYISGKYNRKALQDFFHGTWYSMLVRDSIDPDLLIRHLDEEVKQHHGEKRRIHKEHAQLHFGMR